MISLVVPAGVSAALEDGPGSVGEVEATVEQPSGDAVGRDVSSDVSPDASSDGSRAETRVVGGKNVPISFAPWQVALVDPRAPDAWQGQFCGGSIISTEWIVTAAHCLDDGAQVTSTSHVRILAGDATLSSASGSVSPLRTVRTIVIHPSYDGTMSEDHDIALIRLDSPLTFRRGSLEAIALPTAKASGGTTARISGWGATWMFDESYNGLNVYGTPLYPTRLQGTTVTVQADGVCSSELSSRGVGASWNATTMLCAKTPNWTRDTCFGDSGGPLATSTRSGWELSGVTSWGLGCAWASSGVYVNVANYRSWIEATTLGPGSVPAASALTQTTEGYRFDISNHDPAFNYRVVVRSGSGRVRAGRATPAGLPITVSKVRPGETVTVEIIASRAGHASQSTFVSGAALQVGIRPRLSRPTRTDAGFTFTVTNHDPAYSYAAVITSGVGVVQLEVAEGSVLPVTVTGVARGRSVTVRITSTRTGHTTQVATVKSSAVR